MSYPERAALALVLFLLSAVLLDGCRTTSEAEAHMAASAANTLDATGHIDSQEKRGPLESSGREFKFRAPAYPGESLRDRLVEAARRRMKAGPVTTDTHADVKSQEREDSTLSSESETKRTRDFLHGPLTWIGALVALAGLAYGALKLRKVIP